ncbi:calcineurin-binding protein cabin-1-like [Plodia interpunctella]|uniref:calcineurin-binding protein cabin-1-like n=1 Tax=Plodia interpunctella TaxID=58824 RepID=UPI002367C3B7|nr:calcineurin-binding protein cabin-1-like [Plodia interpunctella]
MIKISALNNESEEESGTDEEVTKEALEQIALQQYSKALDLQKKGCLSEATQLLKDLLDTELLYDVKKPAPGEKVTSPLFNLKYLCYKNLASMLSTAGAVDDAIECYCSATDLDDTDVTLWHRLGQLCMKAKKYEMALQAFQRGTDRNPRHWPCLDKIVTLLLGLDCKEECIFTIYDALQLDPGYLRGLAYRKHIYTTFNYVREYLEYLNPMYKWSEKDDDPIDEEKAEKLLKEAEEIHETFLEQQRAEQFKCLMPVLELKKPISNFSWASVGESFVHMHHYMTEQCFSHACHVKVIFETEEKVEPMDITEESKELEVVENKPEDTNTDVEKNAENISENEINDLSDKDKAATDTEKVESDVEMVPVEQTTESQPEPKQKKTAGRRRGSDLSFLQQWEWCNKRRSGRKKPVNNKDRSDDNIYDLLRRMVPICLSPETVQKKEHQAREASPDLTDIDKMFEDKDKVEEVKAVEEYFGSEEEQKDVKAFITKYTESAKDIIDILKDFLSILSQKWKIQWPENLQKIFIEASKCYHIHVDVPSYANEDTDDLIQYAFVNILVEEFSVNEKFNLNHDEKQNHDLSVIETIGMGLNMKPHLFLSTDCLELTLRHLWAKLHIHILNKCEESALDCLYQLYYEFEAMGEYHDKYNLNIINFTFKPAINESEILAYIKFLERNKKLSTVMDLYNHCNYEDVLSIVIDSFEHCKTMAKKQEEEMSLDFAVQLALILDTYWALDKVDECFKWSLICLHEALKHYFRYTTGSSDYEKWTLTVVKILCCMEHILVTEGLSCLDEVSRKELSQGLEDIIRIIGHQVETNGSEMPFGTVVPWIIMHYILQREEDQGRGRTAEDKDKVSCDDIPNPLMVLFIAHEHLGNRGWCAANDAKLLYFTLDIVVPRLRSPILAKSLEQICQYMEQCVYCLFGHPTKKQKLKYLIDHNVTAQTLDWKRAQQLYEIFRPPILPALEGKISGITADTEQLFHHILALLPPECDPQKYVVEMDKYIKHIEDKLPKVPPLLPYKMKDIYFLLGDYYFKKEEGKLSVKYNTLDVIINNDRLESWAEISLAKVVIVERLINSLKNLNNERDVLNPARSIIRCFKRTLDLDPTHCNMWIEYGMFVYMVHSFCSRLLKQASESLSMEDFESLEKQKENMLDTTQKCFTTVLSDLNNSYDSEKANEDSWLQYYMLGKVAEKRNKPPSVFLQYYMQGVKSLQETNATYPLKINYNTPSHLCIEVLELHYRIHASILKYIEQHEDKPIPASIGKVFMECIEEWKNGPFAKKAKKDGTSENEVEVKPTESVQAANILKRSVSDAGEEETHETKRLKLESAAAKVRRSASYDTDRISKDTPLAGPSAEPNIEPKPLEVVLEKKDVPTEEVTKTDAKKVEEKVEPPKASVPENKKESDTEKKEETSSGTSTSSSSDSSSSDSTSDSTSDSSSDASNKSVDSKPLTGDEIMNIVSACLDALEDCSIRFPQHYKAIYRLAHYHFYFKKGKDIERCRDLMLSNFTSRSGQKLAGLFSERKTSNFFNNIWKIPVSEVDRAGGFTFHMSRCVLLTMEILKEIDDHKTLLDLSLHLQRIPESDKKYIRDAEREELAQQAFSLCVQSLRGQLTKFIQQADLKSNEVEKLALKSLTLDIYRAYHRTQKQAQSNSKQFSNLLVEAYKLICPTPITENMNLVDLSLRYCQSLTQILKQQATQAILDKSQKAEKKQNAKTAEVVKAPSSTSAPVVSSSKHDHKSTPSTSTAPTGLPKMSPHEVSAAIQSYLTMLNDPLSQQAAAALSSLSYLSNLSALAGYPTLQSTLHSSMQKSLTNSFQAEYYRQFLNQSFSSYNLPAPAPKKQKRGPKPTYPLPRQVPTTTSQVKPAKSFATASVITTVSKSSTLTAPSLQKLTSSHNLPKSTSNISKASSSQKSVSTGHHKSIPTGSLQKSVSAPLAPSMGTVLPTLPASMTANLSSFGASAHPTFASTHSQPANAHMSNAITVNAAAHTKPPKPHTQVSPGKTLQEKLAERQKHMPKTSQSMSAQDINASISKLPSSLTITKTSVQKPPVQGKKTEAKKSLPFSNEARPKPISSDEVIVLDDD